MRWRMVVVGVVLLLTGIALGQRFSGGGAMSPEEWFRSKGPVAEDALGRFQAVSDGSGGLLIINTADASVVKHIAKAEAGYTFDFIQPLPARRSQPAQ